MCEGNRERQVLRTGRVERMTAQHHDLTRGDFSDIHCSVSLISEGGLEKRGTGRHEKVVVESGFVYMCVCLSVGWGG